MSGSGIESFQQTFLLLDLVREGSWQIVVRRLWKTLNYLNYYTLNKIRLFRLGYGRSHHG